MSLDIKYWWVRWYLWSLRSYGATRHDEYLYDRFSKMTNLCFFMRVSLIYGPLILLSHIALFGTCLGAFIIVPFVSFGLGYCKFLLIVSAVAACVAGAIYFCSELAPKLFGAIGNAVSSTHEVFVDAINDPRPSNAVILCIQYMRSIKQRSCPLIVLEDKDA